MPTNVTIPEFLVCPVCKGKLSAHVSAEGKSEVVCPACALAYEVRGGIPNMIASFARPLTEDEKERLAVAADRRKADR